MRRALALCHASERQRRRGLTLALPHSASGVGRSESTESARARRDRQRSRSECQCLAARSRPSTRLHKRAAWPDRIESRRQCPASSATIERLADTDRRKRICGDCHRALRRRPRPIGASAMSPPIQSLAMVRGESECARPRLTGFLLGGTSAPLPSCSCECLLERHIATGADCAVCARRELIWAVDARASI